jgi:hypothetical protein
MEQLKNPSALGDWGIRKHPFVFYCYIITQLLRTDRAFCPWEKKGEKEKKEEGMKGRRDKGIIQST